MSLRSQLAWIFFAFCLEHLRLCIIIEVRIGLKISTGTRTALDYLTEFIH